MKTLTLTINCEDAAISDNPNEEIAWLLRNTAEAIEGGYVPSGLYDSNGNRVGEVVVDMGKEG